MLLFFRSGAYATSHSCVALINVSPRGLLVVYWTYTEKMSAQKLYQPENPQKMSQYKVFGPIGENISQRNPIWLNWVSHKHFFLHMPKTT